MGCALSLYGKAVHFLFSLTQNCYVSFDGKYKYLEKLLIYFRMTTHQATIETFEQQIEDIITCIICLETMNDPKVLQCQHTFCCPCLEHLMDTHQSQVIGCPTCRAETRVPRGGVQGLPSDYKVKKLSELNMSGIKTLRNEMEKLSVDLDGKKSVDKKVSSCSICQDKSHWYCKNCSGYMCNPCNEKHQAANIFKDHVIVAGDRNTWETAECKTHPGTLQEYLCKDCFSVVCAFCLIGNHVACNVIQTNDYIKDCHGVIETSFDQLQEVHREMVIREKAVVEQVANAYKSRTSEITEEVTRAANDRIRKIQEEKEKLLHSLQENARQLEEALQLEVDKRSNRSKVEELRTKRDKFLATTTVTDVLADFKELSSDIVHAIHSTLDNQAVPSATTFMSPSEFVQDPSEVSIGSIRRESVDLLPNTQN